MNTKAMGGCEERGFNSVVCPKPRRLGIFNPSVPDHIRGFRWSSNSSGCFETEMVDSKTGTELLDLILTRGSQVVSSPPYFCGSPPVRASNPVIQDAQFNQEKLAPPSPAPPSPSSRIGGSGCVRMKFGNKPAAVRIEGFDCLRRDGHSCSISAVA